MYNGQHTLTIALERDNVMTIAEDMQETRATFVQNFDSCRPALSAMGDENRQLIIRVLIENCGNDGLRVGEIQSNTHISRTAVSHHLKVLLEIGMIAVRREGTKNYYYLNSKSISLWAMVDFWKSAVKMMSFCPLQDKEKK